MLIEGQVLWLRFRFNNRPGDVSADAHPYIVVGIDDELSIVEIIQCDSLNPDNIFKAYLKENHVIRCFEEVITKDSYARLDNCYKVELGDYLHDYKRTEKTLPKDVFSELSRKYKSHQLLNDVAENKTVFMSKSELIKLNK